jgi:hypothetical protein
MSNAGAASLAALIPARAAASRKNGAKSRGPKTPEGKARSAQNALRHGLCARQTVVLGDEDQEAFEALEAALMAELAPRGALQTVLARRIVAATWRLERAERMEAELFAQQARDTTSFGLALIRDCHGGRAFDTLLRYRGTTLAELWRSLRTLQVLQAAPQADAPLREAEAPVQNEPEAHEISGESAPAPLLPPVAASARAVARPGGSTAPRPGAVTENRKEPKARRIPGVGPPERERALVPAAGRG